MAINIDINEILKGEKVICPECNNGYFVPEYNVEKIEDCNHFKCDNCGETIHLSRRLKI